MSLFAVLLLACSLSSPSAYPSGSILSALPPDATAVNANDASFGLVGDGVADDTEGLIAAINATYYGHPDCTVAGNRVVFLEGNGKVYRVTSTIRLPIWLRLIGWGTVERPRLLLAPSTPGFSGPSLAPLLRVVNWSPGVNATVNASAGCNASPLEGGNTAFGVGVLNIDITISPGNAFAVGIDNRVAQGGILRSMIFNLSADTAAGIMNPGWTHQELVFLGGSVGVLIGHTGAWPSIYRDCYFSGQSHAAVGWSLPAQGIPVQSSAWEGTTFLRVLVINVPTVMNATGSSSARISLIDSVFLNVTEAIISPPLFSPPDGGSSSILVRNCTVSFAFASVLGIVPHAPSFIPVTASAPLPLLMSASDLPGDAGNAIPLPGGRALVVSFSAGYLASSARSRASTVTGNLTGAYNVSLQVQQIANDSSGSSSSSSNAQAAESRNNLAVSSLSAAPLPAPPDTPTMPLVSSWLNVQQFGIVGDGQTENSAALNALFANETLASEGGAIFFPLGTYIFDETVTIPAPLQNKTIFVFGLSCWDVVLSLRDASPGFTDPFALKTAIHVSTGGGGTVWISSLNIRSGQTFGKPQPAPVPSDFWNPNPGSLALLWEARFGGMQDVFFHPATFPDNYRIGGGPNTELSLVIAQGGSGVFADIWSCNAYSMGGVQVINSGGAEGGEVLFYQLSSEHHEGHELWLINSTAVVHVMQTEDRSPDAAPTSSIVLQDASLVDVSGLFSYYAANISSLAAILVNDTDSNALVAVHRQYHSYHPLFYNCSFLAARDAPTPAACLPAIDYALTDSY